jgi:hypothetical protein
MSSISAGYFYLIRENLRSTIEFETDYREKNQLSKVFFLYTEEVPSPKRIIAVFSIVIVSLLGLLGYFFYEKKEEQNENI